ncbi:hypothetical protein E3N88_32116 [Mikania micrantha]|uniref:Tf2-1-like SH3-like domain-containing protein n=1 Tax=Mikania micrantha TaxID=192012 RepID=A0A5N6M828_9ASTR|nr:hypothetical protein E3N88_32116 [Mikania micrantha]
MVLHKVSPWKGVVRFGKKGKLAPRYVGPFKILERIGKVAYKLELPPELSNVHPTFHVSNLRKCLADQDFQVPLDDIRIDDTMHFIERPVEKMDREVKKLKRSRILIVKVLVTQLDRTREFIADEYSDDYGFWFGNGKELGLVSVWLLNIVKDTWSWFIEIAVGRWLGQLRLTPTYALYICIFRSIMDASVT